MNNVDNGQSSSTKSKESSQTFIIPPNLLSLLGIQINNHKDNIKESSSSNDHLKDEKDSNKELDPPDKLLPLDKCSKNIASTVNSLKDNCKSTTVSSSGSNTANVKDSSDKNERVVEQELKITDSLLKVADKCSTNDVNPSKKNSIKASSSTNHIENVKSNLKLDLPTSNLNASLTKDKTKDQSVKNRQGNNKKNSEKDNEEPKNNSTAKQNEHDSDEKKPLKTKVKSLKGRKSDIKKTNKKCDDHIHIKDEEIVKDSNTSLGDKNKDFRNDDKEPAVVGLGTSDSDKYSKEDNLDNSALVNSDTLLSDKCNNEDNLEKKSTIDKGKDESSEDNKTTDAKLMKQDAIKSKKTYKKRGKLEISDTKVLKEDLTDERVFDDSMKDAEISKSETKSSRKNSKRKGKGASDVERSNEDLTSETNVGVLDDSIKDTKTTKRETKDKKKTKKQKVDDVDCLKEDSNPKAKNDDSINADEKAYKKIDELEDINTLHVHDKLKEDSNNTKSEFDDSIVTTNSKTKRKYTKRKKVDESLVDDSTDLDDSINIKPVKRRKTANQSVIETETTLGKRTPKLNKSFTDFCTGKQKKPKREDEEDVKDDDDCKSMTIDHEVDIAFYNKYLNLPTNSENCDIKCLICDQVVENSWEVHKLKHNNLVEELAVISDDKVAIDNLENIFRKTGLLICEKCCYRDSNVLSFFKHVKSCEISSKRWCKICGRSWIKSTKDDHMELHDSNISKQSLHQRDSDSKITCACCKTEMLYSDWEEHNIKHNQLAWIDGDQPVDMSMKNIRKILNPIFKLSNNITCFDCTNEFASVMKFIKHMQSCGKEMDDEEKPLSYLKVMDKSQDSKFLDDESDVNNTTILSEFNDTLKTPKIKKEVTCMKCDKTMPKSGWNAHKLQHNNLTWNNEETPIDLDNRKLCESILVKVLKKGKTLKCETCNEKKKSAVGFLSHLERCNKSEEEILLLRVPCSICGRLYAKSSIQAHMYQNHSTKNPDPQPAEVEPANVEESVDERKSKRKAATKALDLIEDLKKGVVQSSVKTINDLFTTPSKIRIANPVIICWKKEISNSEDGKANCRNIPCSFKSSDLEELKSHHLECELHPKHGYWCKVCSFRTEDENIMKDHVTKEHSSEIGKKIEDDDPLDVVKKKRGKNDEDFDIDSMSESDNDIDDLSGEEMDETIINGGDRHGSIKRGTIKFSFLVTDPSVFSCRLTQCLRAAKKWTLKFREKNYSKTPLFSDLCNMMSNMVPLALHTTYFSTGGTSSNIASVSGRYNKNSKAIAEDVSWKSYNQFETSCNDHGVATIFCGGPVWGLAWCPSDDESSDQFLAVSTHRHFEDAFKIDNRLNSHDKKGVIQIWNVGQLSDETAKCTTNPKLLYMIAHNYGAIWRLEWCPSGGLCNFKLDSKEDESKRIGLLSAACSDGNIYIFSICIPPILESNIVPLYYQMPVAVLRIGHGSDTNFHATALSWTKESGHNIIGAGFSSGFVGLWDLTISSQLLRHKHADILCLHPYHIFKAHLSGVTCLAIFSYFDSSYILTGAKDRAMQFWKVNSGNGRMRAFPLNGTFGKTNNNSITASTWNVHWMTPLIALDDIYGRANSSFFAVRDYTFKSTIVLNSCSMIWDLASCDWSNGFCQVTEGGELSAIYPHQLMAYIDSSKTIKRSRLMIGMCRIRKLQSDDASDSTPCDEDKTLDNSILNEANVDDMNETQDIDKTIIIDEADMGSSKKRSKKVKSQKNLDMSECNELSDEDIGSAASEGKRRNIIWESNYKDIIKNHGIVFYDLSTDSHSRSFEITELQNTASPHYPLNALTRVSYNPNKKCHSFIAVGMYAGFVRIRCIEGLRTLGFKNI